MSRPKRRPQGWLQVVGRVALAIGLLAVVVSMNRGEFRKVLAHTPDGRLFLVGFLLYFVGVLLSYLRWYALVRALGLPFRVRDAVRLGFIGLFFNMVIPGAVGGDFVKMAYLRREQEQKAQAVASIIFDRLVGVLGLFLLAAVVGTMNRARLGEEVRRLVGVAWVAVAVALAIMIVAFTPLIYHALHRRIGPGRKLGRVLAELAAMGAAYRSRPGVVALAVITALATHVLNVLAFYAASRGLFPDVPTLAEHFLMVPLVLFTTAAPLPFGALGLSEGISQELFRLANYDGGAVAMIGFRVFQFAGAFLSMWVYLANRRQVRALASTEPEAKCPAGPRALNSAPVKSGLAVDQ